MALTYSDSAALMNDLDFRGRIKIAVLKFATSIYGEPADTAAHNTRVKWAQNAFLFPDQVATSAQPLVVMDDNVQAQGSAIDDAGLQTATEYALQKML